MLRKQWGFEGAVVCDWGGVDDRVAALAAGLDLQMPGNEESTTPRSCGRSAMESWTRPSSIRASAGWGRSPSAPSRRR
nr:hypothetical protein [Actinomadura rifamycini]